LARAAALCEESVTVCRDADNRPAEVMALIARARVAAEMGDQMRARASYREALALARPLALKRQIAECVEGVASAFNADAVRLRDLHEDRDGSTEACERAVHLYGAAAALRGATGDTLSPTERAAYEDRLKGVRALLGEERFAAMWAQGETLTLEQAAAIALVDDETADLRG
jgi:hypothetical protein